MVIPVVVVLASVLGQTIQGPVVEKQDEVFQRMWAEDFEWKFDQLPTEGKVSEHRIPYSGYIYPDSACGTMQVLRKYDSAFNGGNLRATMFEQRDTSLSKPITRQETYTRRGLFGRGRTVTRMVSTVGVPHWYGHCNGWTAAAMRHAEPQKSVKRNGVEFTPADIKGMLAEIYIYNDHIVLAGEKYHMNPGTFHAIIANWLGRGDHPVAMESDPGKEKWNYPIYGFTTSSSRRGQNQVDVRTTIAYARNSRGELQQSPRIEGKKYFHYGLKLDDAGAIVGGYWYRDSSRIEMLWIPLHPHPGGQPGNERGNPHVDVDEVLAIWRESVPADVRQTWLVVDPAPLDRVLKAEQLADANPVQEPIEIEEPADETVVAASFEEETDAAEPDGDRED